MRYMLLIYTDEESRPAWGTPEGDAEAEGYNTLHAELTHADVIRGGDPVLRVAEAKSVQVRNGETSVKDGPAVTTPIQLGGYYVVECDDIEEAARWASKIPGATYGTIEVRPILELP
jgi:hypothetical protein